MDFVDYFLYDAHRDHITESESFIITNGLIKNPYRDHITFRGLDSGIEMKSDNEAHSLYSNYFR
jgi:hypothetical protein